MIASKFPACCCALLLLCGVPAQAQTQSGGFIKSLVNARGFSSDSVFYAQEGSETLEPQGQFRFNLQHSFKRASRWDLNIAYQLALIDTSLDGVSPEPTTRKLANDDRRFFDLSATLNADDPRAVHRLDRFNFAYTGKHWVVRAGRQALSWGNGLLFSLLDIVNPFDARTYDQEYKAGDDMLYLQYLFADGSDLQMASVYRRDPASAEAEADEHTHAVKYHAFFDHWEADVLAARHYGEHFFGLGVSASLGGAIAYTELSQVDTDRRTLRAALLGLSYSWVWFERNFSGVLEYYRNDVGLEGNFAYEDVLATPLLLARLNRGETALLARQYVGASSSVQLSPLLTGSANVFVNLEDDSVLLQLSSQYNWRQNTNLFFALALPLGEKGGEFSGLPANISETLFYSSEWQAQAKLSWYF